MYALGGHARRTVLPRAVRSLGAQQANYATRGRPPGPPKPVKPQYANEVAAKLAADGVWNSMRAVHRGKPKHAAKNTDKYRVNVVSEKLCDDAINYIRPTLARHEGCDLIDIFPGVGIWSQKLNDVLRPRSHILMEPDEDFYKPYLQPLLDRPGTRLLPESGIIWDQLTKVLNPTVLPHQVERKYASHETPQRNDTLLVSINLCMTPKRKFRSFESLAQLVLFQLISSIRPGALFQKYGLVRMLIWAENSEKASLVPRTVQRRKKMSIEAEISTDWVCEVVGGDYDDPAVTRSNMWFRRDDSIDFESTRRTLERMREHGFVMPPGREPHHLQAYLDVEKLKADDVVGATTHSVDRPYMVELEGMEAAFANGEFAKGSKELKRYKALTYLRNFANRRSDRLVGLIDEHDAIAQAYVDAGSDEDKLAHAIRRGQAWTDKIRTFERHFRQSIVLHRDNVHVLRQDPPIMNWDRRYVEPLRASPSEFFPEAPCSLLDVQPKAAAPVLRDIGPDSSRGGDTFDQILRGISQRPMDPVVKSLGSMAPGAGDGVAPHCPSLFDPRRGGVPPGLAGLASRALNEAQLIELAYAWMKWPFRPTYAELVSRTLEESDVEDDEGRQFAASE
ncbi:hypothetical protein C8A01DRAFT_41253 [Parachaetomium inaequale]|uniref:Mitochondrial transcription factor 1 n=1 Tax=Parachaetomium inaequale TaxID=2588326 RepID=A0AAN6SM87_9PEZI|nr:hypothetical protein C8A01DRAFT_41253 [Parachaetomium inaequale]